MCPKIGCKVGFPRREIYPELIISQDKPDFSTPMTDWHKEKVKVWLRLKTKMEEDEIHILVEDEVDGRTLSELDQTMLVAMGFEETRAMLLHKTVKKWNSDLVSGIIAIHVSQVRSQAQK